MHQEATQHLSQACCEAILANILEPILVFEDSTCILDVNPAACEMLGCSREVLSGKHIGDMLPVEYRKKIFELLGQTHDKETLWGNCTSMSVAGEPNDFEFCIMVNILPSTHMIVFRNVTARQRAEADLRGHVERMQMLSRRIIEIQEEERRHLARELHDELGQVLSAISVNLHGSDRFCSAAGRSNLNDSLQMIDGAVQQVRNLSLDLRPSMLDDLGLVSTLRWYADRQAQRGGFSLHFSAESSGARLPPDLVTACYRVAQEAFTNVVRHAQACDAWLDFRCNDNLLELMVRDNGIGFDLEAVRQRAAEGTSLGLLGMRERVELLGGQIRLESQVDCGTAIHVWFYLAENHDSVPVLWWGVNSPLSARIARTPRH